MSVPQLEFEKLEARVKPRKKHGWFALLTRMALQNMQRRRVRTALLVLSVALAVGAVFASYTVACGVAASTEQGFARMGADLIVVPEKTMVNITSALLTVQPTDEAMSRETFQQIRQLNGVEKATPQTIYHVSVMAGMPEHKANLIAFDPNSDFTVLPWLVSKQTRPIAKGELIAGARRTESLGEEIQPCDTPATIYGKLGLSGVGPFDESLFATYDTVASILSKDSAQSLCSPQFAPSRISAALVKLKFGATAEQVRFAISRIPGVKVISGASVVTYTRQSTTAMLNGIVIAAALMLISSLILVGLLFSAIISERKREIGVLRAIGARQIHIVGMLTAEAAVTTGTGGIAGIMLGIAFMLMFENSIVYYLKTLHMDFAWPAKEIIAITAILLAALAAFAGIIAAAIPALLATRKEPYVLIQGEDARC